MKRFPLIFIDEAQGADSGDHTDLISFSFR